ncbi:MAG: alpha-1,4-glucan--maltose-1-phosphate maltosyltransferase [Aeromicrobium sp.]
MITRIPIMDVRPQLEGGRFPVKAVVDERFRVQARVFGEGRAQIGAAVILTGPDGIDLSPILLVPMGNDFWSAEVSADKVGPWTFRIESWSDPYATWFRDAPIKIEAGVDVDLVLAEGVALLERANIDDPIFLQELEIISDATKPPLDRLVAGLSLSPFLEAEPLKDHHGAAAPLPFFVDRPRALFGSWYEFFPRSEGARRAEDGEVVTGTLKTAAKRLEAVADMGFDVIYLPPIHPIGTFNRKGKNNTLTATTRDPGSPWAIGSSDGGHDAVHPDLGTIEDFDDFVAHAQRLKLEVALDFALQCAPDHPWVKAHPEWFITRIDGSIAFAENPPKKYQDIYPLDFDGDPEGLYAEIARILRFWIDHGVTVFRVDNPHTKPLGMWARLLADIRQTRPEVIFLAEAFTVPAMLQGLAMVGFHQSYTYITWRETKAETAEYLEELSRDTSDFLRPNFFVNTPDILPRYLQSGDKAIFEARAVLAATSSPAWGMYAGYELREHEAAGPDSEEYLNSEKYEIKIRDWDRPDNLVPFITKLNDLRRRHPALQQLRDLHIHTTNEDSVLCFSKRSGEDVVVVVVDLSPGDDKVVRLTIDPTDIGLEWGIPFVLQDELSGEDASFDGVDISAEQPARIFAVVTP